jgi:general secretion pathway protein A
LRKVKKMNNYKSFYGFSREPFSQDIKTDELYKTPALQAFTERFLYSITIAAVTVVTGEAGSGKSTALRYASEKLHPSMYRVISVIANTGSVIEMLRQICICLDIECRTHSIAILIKTIKNILAEITQKKQMPVLIIDEAQLMRIEVFAQIHTIGQFEMDSKPVLPIILSGQNNLIDKLLYPLSRPIATRIVGRSHFEGMKLQDTAQYLKWHLEIAGIKEHLFTEESVLAIHQSSGGLPRKINNLARCSLIASAKEKSHSVSAEHVRIASTEII